uniref:Activin_recp domain-containing protein n=1 Tax=Strongyloides stercoralis TaxID=6248 RepID=A0A0K0ECF5_STRER
MKEGSYNSFFGSGEYDDYMTLKCNCTKGSNKSGCDNNGICVVDDKRNAACLMLYSPERGIHYGCANKRLTEDSCTIKTTKLNNKAIVCACSRENFCNYYKWPDYESIAKKFKNNPEFIEYMALQHQSKEHSNSKNNHHSHRTTYHKHVIQDSDVTINKTLYAQKIENYKDTIFKKYQNSANINSFLYTFMLYIMYYIIIHNIV